MVVLKPVDLPGFLRVPYCLWSLHLCSYQWTTSENQLFCSLSIHQPLIHSIVLLFLSLRLSFPYSLPLSSIFFLLPLMQYLNFTKFLVCIKGRRRVSGNVGADIKGINLAAFSFAAIVGSLGHYCIILIQMKWSALFLIMNQPGGRRPSSGSIFRGFIGHSLYSISSGCKQTALCGSTIFIIFTVFFYLITRICYHTLKPHHWEKCKDNTWFYCKWSFLCEI